MGGAAYIRLTMTWRVENIDKWTLSYWSICSRYIVHKPEHLLLAMVNLLCLATQS